MASGHGTIGIHFMPSDGHNWADFLQQKFNEDGYNIRCMLLDLTATTHFFETNILLVSPDFFNLNNLGVLQTIDPHRALMVLLGTTSEDVQAFLLRHKCNEMLKNITFFETVATENCVRELLIGIIKLYEHNYEPSDDETAHKEIYDVLPVPRPRHLSTNGVNDVAISCNEENREVYLLCDRKGNDEIQIKLADIPGQIKAVHENKAIYRFTIDKNVPSGSGHLQFTAKDGELTIGTGVINIPNNKKTDVDPKESNRSKLDKLQEILGEENNPICLMCKALNLSENSTEALDTNLAKKCHCLEPLRRFEGMFCETNRKSIGHSNEIWPSLLHFAAEFNLPKFCEELLKLPYSMDETFIMNKDSETPLEIAKRKDHIVVIKQLEYFTERETRNGNVPGNKDSGVVDDIHQAPSVHEQDEQDGEYTDMSQISTRRDSSISLDEGHEDMPPPPPHSTTPYVNVGSVHSHEDSNEPPPVAHVPQTCGDSDSSGNYMEMSGHSVPHLTELSPSHLSHDQMSRSKSESATGEVIDEDDEDVDYEIPGEYDDTVIFDLQPTYQEKISEEEIQLPLQANTNRQSGFFKKFKQFVGGKPNKKDKKYRDRKMSLPSEISIKAFQNQKSKSGRRGSIPAVHVPYNRGSSSSNSSSEMPGQDVFGNDIQSKSFDTLMEDTRRKKKTHFLNKDARKSIRITKALGDQALNFPAPLSKSSRF